MIMLSRTLALAAVFGVGLMAIPARAQEGGVADKDVKAMAEKALEFLRTKQAKDGSFGKFGPGVTAIVIAGLARNGYGDDPVVTKALESLTKSVKKDGGIYEARLANYTTAVGVMALAEVNKDGKYDAVIKSAAGFLKKLQHDDVANTELKFGGASYDGKGKGKGAPDLSNTQMFIDALIAAGVSKDDPAIKNAMVFVSRCQNYTDKEKGNDQKWAAKAKDGDKGGFVYNPGLDPEDAKNPHATGDGGLRSVGAMTYAGLKSFLYAGVDKKDPRVQGALKWIRNHYTLEENPGMGKAGLFYYYNTFAKTMSVLGEDTFEDAKGTKHDWRKELFEALKKQQGKDGGFVNKGDIVFGEGDPSLATAFALLSLSYVKKK